MSRLRRAGELYSAASPRSMQPPKLVRTALPAHPNSLGRVVHLPLPDSDAALVAALQGGREAARQELVTRYADDVERLLYRVLGPDPEIPDLLQEVFVVGLTSLDHLRDPRALRSWLCSIAVRKARKLIAHRRRWRFIRSMPPGELPEHEAPAAPVEVSDALRCTYRILDTFSAEERVAFALRYVEGMELLEVAELTGVSLATTKRRLARAYRRFVELARDSDVLANWLDAGSFDR